MGKSALTSQGKSHAGLLEPLKQQFLNALRGPGATEGHRLRMRAPEAWMQGRVPVETEPELP
eukprot:scaffold17410_cov57-Phaeocystis_antarctica.AAC.1